MRFLNPIYTHEWSAIIIYRGEKYAVSVELEYNNHGMPDRCSVQFAPAPNAELTKSIDHNIAGLPYEVKWGGWPEFIQGEIWPATDDGNPFDYLCTINIQWGDNGNVNIFISTQKTATGYEVLETYLEASCH